jgi:hypothetical protein
MGAVVHVLVSEQNRDEQTEIDINIPTYHMNEELMHNTYSGKLRPLQSCTFLFFVVIKFVWFSSDIKLF